MSLSAEQKDAIEILVGLCMSSKDPPTMSQLLRDYTELEGKQLDYSGFNTITEFLRASDRFHLINRGGMLIVNAKLTSESVHIAVMVGKQRSTSKRRGRGAGPPTRDGLFHVAVPRKRFTPPFNSRSTGIRSIRPLTQARTYQQPHTVPYTPSSSYNQSFPKRATLPSLTITTTRNGSGAPVQRHVSSSSAPLPSQLAKVIKPEVQQTAPPQPVSTAFQFPVQNKVEQYGRVETSYAQRPLSKVTKPELAAQKPVEYPGNVVATNGTRKPMSEIPKPQSNTGFQYTDQSFALNNDRSEHPPKTLTVGQEIERVTERFKNIPFDQIDIENRMPRVPMAKQRQDDHIVRVNSNVIVPTTKRSTVNSPGIPKPSVQDRLYQIKRGFPDIDYVMPEPSKSTVGEVSEETNIVIPLEWWTTGDFSNVKRLEEYCRVKRFLPPDFKYFKVRNGRHYKYQCRVTIEGETYSTYPEDFNTQEQSRDSCASIANRNFKQQEELSQYPIFEGGPQEIASKIYDVVNEHDTGVFLREIPNLFRSKYNFSIPSNYIRIITLDFEHWFIVEQHLTSSKRIVYAVKRSDVILSSTDSLSNEADTTDSSILPPQIYLPWDHENWNVFVTCPQTTTSIRVNLLGPDYYEARVDLEDKLDGIDTLERPTEILTNECYIAVVHKERSRVKVVGIDTENRVLSSFIDTGEQEYLTKDQLYVCDAKFLELPPQAIPLSLEGLSLFKNLDGIDYYLSDLNEKVLVAALRTTKEQYEKNGNVIEVVLYDTSTDDDIIVNDELLNQISETGLKPAKLNDECINNVVITSVLDSGIVTGYLKIAGYIDLVKKEIRRVVADKNKLQQHKAIVNGAGKEDELYLAYNETSGQYFRAKLIKPSNYSELNEVIVYFIDYGTANKIIPPQAIRMRLHGIENFNDPNVVSLLRGLLKPDTITIVKVNELADEPLVSIYIRTSTGQMQSVNEAIKAQTALT